MLLHQDASSHEWVAGQIDLVVTLDDATSEVYSGLLRRGGRHHHVPSAARGDRRERAAARSRTGPATTAHAGGRRQGRPDNPTQVGRALAQLGIELFAAYSPEARGRSERMFGTLQKRLPQELRLAITTMKTPTASDFWPAHNRRFARPVASAAFVAFAGSRHTGVQHRPGRQRRRCATTTSLHPLAMPPLRQGRGAGARISRRQLAVFHGQVRPAGRVTRFARPAAAPCASGQQAKPTCHVPTGPTARSQFIWYTNRSIQFVIDRIQVVANTR